MIRFGVMTLTKKTHCGIVTYGIMNDKPRRESYIIVPDEIIMNKIYLIREKKVMLDRDLAVLYGVDTKVLKQTVRRHIRRFPPDFMFE